jgi:bla regulator protein BlaR1
MVLYFLKSILCLAILLVVYILFLEKEKMHRFNRWYLLSSIVFACIVPLISLKINTESLPVLQNNYFEAIGFSEKNNALPQAAVAQQEPVNYLAPALLVIYALVSFTLIIRFVRNIYLLLSNAAKNKIVFYGDAKLVLLKEKVASHSFLNYIFISEEDYKEQSIEEELITHELTHVKEKHSWDVIFIEVMQTIFWFNPMLFFYKKAIQLNHEYLADEAVIKTFEDVPAYQCLLLDKASCQCNTSLTSNFNYSVTKKRLVMMTKTTNQAKALLKKLSVIPILASAVFIFSSRSTAQETVKAKPQAAIVPSTKEGVSKQMFDEIGAIIDKHRGATKNGHKIIGLIPEDETNRIQTIYFQMTKEQQAAAPVAFIKRTLHKPAGRPTDAQFESWKDAAKYGVWINGKKVKNSELDKYTADDFGDYDVSNLNYTEKMKQDVMKSFNLTTMYEKQLNIATKEEADKSRIRDEASFKKNPYWMGFKMGTANGERLYPFVL